MPHIPVHFLVVLLYVEWSVHLNRYVPAFANVKDVASPMLMEDFFDQLAPIDFTLCDVLIAFQVTRVPCRIDTDLGLHFEPEGHVLHDTPLITTAETAGCRTSAPSSRLTAKTNATR